MSIDYKEMSDEQVMDKLLNVDTDNVPTKTVGIKRLEIPIKLKALTAKQVFKLRELCTVPVKNRFGETKQLDNEAFNVGLIVKATVSPNWGDEKLLEKFKASSGSEVVKRLFLSGELDSLGDEVLDLSGYNTELEDINDIKNSSEPDTESV